jgi:hypothetical protein
MGNQSGNEMRLLIYRSCEMIRIKNYHLIFVSTNKLITNQNEKTILRF